MDGHLAGHLGGAAILSVVRGACCGPGTGPEASVYLLVVPPVPRIGPGASTRDMGFSVHAQGDPAREEACRHHVTGGSS